MIKIGASKLFLLFNFFLACCFSQVTIGSKDAPEKGALLDLKQSGVTNKGLGLPRVSLFEISKLKMGEQDEITGLNQRLDHTGLVVYNIYDEAPFCEGVYVWTGEYWEALFPSGYLKPDITMTDGDGNVYPARWFPYEKCNPDNGGYWTTSNLYSTTNGQGQPFSSYPVRLNLAIGGNPVTAPSPPESIINTIGDIINSPLILQYDEGLTTTTLQTQSLTKSAYVAKFGLHYKQSQALEACPTGWHLPSDSEWTKLIDGHGGPFKAVAKMRNANMFYRAHNDMTIVNWGQYDPNPSPHSGFNIIPSGECNYQAMGKLGSMIYFWASEPKVTYYFLNNFNVSMRGEYAPELNGLSVRCVKNGN